MRAVQQIRTAQEDADRRVSKEIKAHFQTKEKMKAIQAEHAHVQECFDSEKAEHDETQKKLAALEKMRRQFQENVKEQLDELTTVKLSNEALNTEMEAQRKAFQVHMNWGARHAELLKKHNAVKDELEHASKEVSEMKAQLAEFGDNAGTVKEQLAELAKYKEQLEQERFRKQRGKGQAMATLEKQLANSNAGVLAICCKSWADFIKQEKVLQARKDKGMKRAARMIAAAGEALMGTIFNAWSKDTKDALREALKAQKRALEGTSQGEGAERARQNALRAMQKNFAAQGLAILKFSVEGWKKVMFAKKRADQNKSAALRSIAGSDAALTAQCFQAWKGGWEQAKGTKEKKDASMQKAMRMINGSQQALVMHCADAWLRLAKNAKQQLAKIAMVERNLLSEGRGLQDLIITKWRQWVVAEKKKKAGKDRNMQRALRGIAASGTALLLSILQPWRKFAEDQKGKQRTKDQSMQRAGRMINNSQQALTTAIVQNWGKLARKHSSTNTKLRVLQRIMGHDNLQVTVCVWYGWCLSSDCRGASVRAKLEDVMAQLQAAKVEVDAQIARGEESLRNASEKDVLLKAHKWELDQSRQKARGIKEELEKVGVFLSTSPKKSPRPASGNSLSNGSKMSGSKKSSRDESGTTLPKIGNRDMRPASGNRTSGENPKQAWQEA
jgi:hypothetical protein